MYLGHVISKHGIEVDPINFAAIRDFHHQPISNLLGLDHTSLTITQLLVDHVICWIKLEETGTDIYHMCSLHTK